MITQADKDIAAEYAKRDSEKAEADKVTAEAKVAEEVEVKAKATAVDDAEVEITLSDDTISEVEKSVVEANVGKLKADLTVEIEAAKQAKIEETRKEAAVLIAKVKELSALEENVGKTPKEIQDLAETAVYGDSEEDKVEEGVVVENKDAKPEKDLMSWEITSEEKAKTDDGKEVELPESVKAQLNELKAIKEDKALAAFFEAKTNGTATDFADEFRKHGLHVDVKSIKPEDIYRFSLNEAKSFDDSITEEDIEEKVEEFSTMDKFDRANLTKPLYARMEQEQAASREVFFGKQKETNAVTKESAQRQVEEVRNELKNYEGKNIYGLDFTPQITEQMLSEYLQGGVRFTTADGKVDVRKTVIAQFKTKYFDEIILAQRSKTAKETSVKEAIRRGKPNAGYNIVARANAQQFDSRKELALAIDSAYGKKN